MINEKIDEILKAYIDSHLTTDEFRTKILEVLTEHIKGLEEIKNVIQQKIDYHTKIVKEINGE